MARFRPTIAGLMVLILVLAIGLAALRGATLPWAVASIVLALMVLCSSLVGVAIRRGAGRALWIRFAIFGWTYFLLHFGPGVEWKSGYGPAQFTTWAVDRLLLPRIAPELEEGQPIGGAEEFVILLNSGQSGSFFDATFHAWASVIFGLLGSAIGLILSEPAARAREGAAGSKPSHP
jgi:hypothetical protein